jgi:hypothetical protein
MLYIPRPHVYDLNVHALENVLYTRDTGCTCTFDSKNRLLILEFIFVLENIFIWHKEQNIQFHDGIN